MARVAGTRLKREVFIEGPGLVVLGAHQQRPGADGFGRLRCPQLLLSRITERSNADAPRWEASSHSGVRPSP
jgi:hypothetical protein